MDAQVARELVELLDERNSDAAALARLASLAVKIEPELLRALRLELLPGADVSAEADLWFSEIVATRSPGAIVLIPEVAELLRAEIPGGADRSWAVVRRVHRALPQILRVEEQLTWLALSGGKEVRVERRLQLVLAAMLGDKGGRRREDLSAWALRALPRLPPAARELPAFWSLLFLASATLKAASVPALAARPAALRGMPRGVLEAFGAAHVELEREGDTLRLRQAATAGPGTIEVPATRPIVLEVTSTGAPTTVALAPRGWTELQVAGDSVRIDAVDGRGYVVTAAPAAEDEGAAAGAEEEAEQDLFQGCARVLIRGLMRISGYLVAPDLVATCSFPFEGATSQAVSVFLGGVEREATVAAIDSDADIALLRLDTPILGILPYDFAGGVEGEERWLARFLGPEDEPILLEGPFDGAKIAHTSGIFELPTVHADRGLLTDLAWSAVRDLLAGSPVLVRRRVVGHIRHAEGSSRGAEGFTAARVFVSGAASIVALLRSTTAGASTPADTELRITDLEKLRRASSRVFRPGGGAVGTAYLVDTDLAVTAAHVVTDGEDRERRASSIQLHFQASIDRAIDARVLRVDVDADCAILRLSAVPEGIEPLPLEHGGVLGGRWWMFGFPGSNWNGVVLDGTLLEQEARAESPVLQLAWSGLIHDMSGMSGSPVFSQGAVIGHFVSEMRSGTLYACPAAAVRALLGPQEGNFLPACASFERGGVAGTAYLVAPTVAATSSSLLHEIGEPITLTFAVGTRVARVSELGSQEELALLRFDEPVPIDAVDLASGASTGERWMARWPAEGGGLRLEGRVVGEVKPAASVHLLLECPVFSQALAGGLAGAPVEVNGRVVGHLTGYVGPAPDNPEFLHLHACPGRDVRGLLEPVEVRGTMDVDSLYLERGADRQLLVTLLERRPCYVFAPRQSGKSSLIRHAAQQLKLRGFRCAVVDLSFISAKVKDMAAWFLVLTGAIMRDLGLPKLPPSVFVPGVSSFMVLWEALADTLRRSGSESTVLFLDEIEYIRSWPFAEEVLSTLRRLAESGAPPVLIPCLVGCVFPEDLLPDHPESLSSLEAILVEDFRIQDMGPMLEALGEVSYDPEALLKAVFDWTDGHLFLTRFLCSELLREPRQGPSDGAERVAALVRERLLEAERAGISTLAHIEYLVRMHERRRALLEVYAGVLRGVPFERRAFDEVSRALLSIGLCKRDGEGLRVRNRIFAALFDEAWISRMSTTG